MTLTLAVLGLLSALVPLVLWWLKRRQAPSPEEKAADAYKELDQIWDEILRARERGDQARADELLRAVRSRHVLVGLRAPISAVSNDSPSGELGGGDAAQRSGAETPWK